jgi:hypothetical protein
MAPDTGVRDEPSVEAPGVYVERVGEVTDDGGRRDPAAVSWAAIIAACILAGGALVALRRYFIR